MHRIIRGLVRARVLVALLLGLLLVGSVVSGVQSGPPLPSIGLGLPSAKREPQATENYLKGNQAYNAELMWNSLSDDAIERYRSRGRTVQDMQRQLEAARERGTAFQEINYVGGQSLPDGTSLQFYVVATRGPASRADLEYVTYIFTLDRSGKIARVQ